MSNQLKCTCPNSLWAILFHFALLPIEWVVTNCGAFWHTQGVVEQPLLQPSRNPTTLVHSASHTPEDGLATDRHAVYMPLGGVEFKQIANFTVKHFRTHLELDAFPSERRKVRVVGTPQRSFTRQRCRLPRTTPCSFPPTAYVGDNLLLCKAASQGEWGMNLCS